MTAHDILAKWWHSTNVQIGAKNTDESQIVALENRYGISIPDDFREYLKNAPAVADWDAEGGAWWSIDRIKNIPDEYEYIGNNYKGNDLDTLNDLIAQNAHEHLFFVDFMAWCWAWAINCGQGENRGKVAIISGGGNDYYVADSFTEFVTKYTTDKPSVDP